MPCLHHQPRLRLFSMHQPTASHLRFSNNPCTPLLSKHPNRSRSSFSTSPSKRPSHQHHLQVTAAAAHAAATAAAPAAAAKGHWLYRVATGVPFLELFETLPQKEAMNRATSLIITAILGTVVGIKILNYIATLIENKLRQQEESGSMDMPGKRLAIGSAFIALRTPAVVLLPYACVSFCSTVVAAYLDVMVARAHHATRDGIVKLGWLNVCGEHVVEQLQNLAQIMQDTTEVLVIVLVAWFVLLWKNRMVDHLIRWKTAEDKTDGQNLARILQPASTLLSWGLIAMTVFTSLSTAGVDVAPLLAFGSVSTLAVGLAAQSTVTNVVSAFSLYTSRPFIVGDRVSLKTLTGALIVSGTVKKILPMQTIIVTDSLVQTIINNKDVAGMIIVNESKEFVLRDTVPPYPSIETNITVRYADVDKIPAIEKEATNYIKNHPRTVSSCRCTMTGFDTFGPVLTVKFSLEREVYKERGVITSEILREVERIVRQNGALLGMEEGVQPPYGGGFDSMESGLIP